MIELIGKEGALMSKKFRVGVVGAGAISGRYIGTIQKKFPMMEIVSVRTHSLYAG